ncbi:hypothetical protein GTCCBUS3UF5_4360 [Geobacillus thermoleovorans CCB_US3_UF5]|uniref:Uncharacterized protein n=1 Tax=Geobacillus thermoleovorans CCB_US3_UF5 TaxID=1111068 RepID=A0ABM5MDJ7_GEOTH|nr:hypothetical protein GTCCBUS3UF5_4360 [Geobacillus thermoleovorans CCB_US3_UF5]
MIERRALFSWSYLRHSSELRIKHCFAMMGTSGMEKRK